MRCRLITAAASDPRAPSGEALAMSRCDVRKEHRSRLERSRSKVSTQALHSWRLAFRQPRTGHEIVIESPTAEGHEDARGRDRIVA